MFEKEWPRKENGQKVFKKLSYVQSEIYEPCHMVTQKVLHLLQFINCTKTFIQAKEQCH